MKRPTSAQFAAYQQIFDYFNQNLFAGILPDCLLSFGKQHGLYAFNTEQWRGQAGSITPEISLNVKQIREGDPRETMASLVRAMVHLWQDKYGSPSRNGYYNREWAKKMEEVGLIPTSSGKPGGKRTGQGIKHYIEPGGKFERAFNKMPYTSLWPFRPTAYASKRYTLKTVYHCPGCGAKVWGKGGLGIICECGKIFADKSGLIKSGVRESVLLAWVR